MVKLRLAVKSMYFNHQDPYVMHTEITHLNSTFFLPLWVTPSLRILAAFNFNIIKLSFKNTPKYQHFPSDLFRLDCISTIKY